MAADPPRREHKPLVERVDALLRRHQEAQQRAEAEVPLLTEIVESAAGGAPALDARLLEALAGALEQAVLERMGPELQRALEAHVREALRAALDEAARALHDDLSAAVRTLAREAVADAVARALGSPLPQAGADAPERAAPAAPPPDPAQG